MGEQCRKPREAGLRQGQAGDPLGSGVLGLWQGLEQLYGLAGDRVVRNPGLKHIARSAVDGLHAPAPVRWLSSMKAPMYQSVRPRALKAPSSLIVTSGPCASMAWR